MSTDPPSHVLHVLHVLPNRAESQHFRLKRLAIETAFSRRTGRAGVPASTGLDRRSRPMTISSAAIILRDLLGEPEFCSVVEATVGRTVAAALVTIRSYPDPCTRLTYP